MGTKNLLLVSVLILSFYQLKAQVNPAFHGARSESMANATVAVKDIWAIYNNQALLGSLDKPAISIGHQTGLIKAMNTEAIAFAYPTKTGTIALFYSYYGSKNFNENNIGLAFGRKLGKWFSLGIKINYMHIYQSGDYKDFDNASFDIGVAYHASEQVLIGAQVYNPVNLTKSSEILSYSSGFRIGAAYYPVKDVVIAGEVEKENNFDTNYKLGIDGKVGNYFSISAGVSSNPLRYSFGCGFFLKDFVTHIAFVRHTNLGYKPSFTLSYRF